ncbi:bile acid:sodium symporter family protein [Haloferax sp. DFSO52]|uniref:bile acid:sodium symporter family protein n=1 Tax=Haloferax sp. DFSO52 TaxID=3388505 RepID=UPI003A84FC65
MILLAVTGTIDTVTQALGTLQGIFVTVFMAGTMAVVGMQLTRGDVFQTVRSYNLLARWLLANVIAVPLFAIFLWFVFGFSESLLIGLILVAVAPGAPFIPRLVLIAGEDSKLALELTASLTVVAAVVVPVLTTAILLFVDVREGVSLFRFLLPLVLVLVVPMVVGMSVRDLSPDLATRLTKPVAIVSNIALLATLAVIVILNPGGIIRVLVSLFGTGSLFVIALFVLGTIAIGWFVGGPTEEGRRILALACAARNIGIALFVVTVAFPDSNADATIVAYFVLMFVISGGVAYYWGRTKRTLPLAA